LTVALLLAACGTETVVAGQPAALPLDDGGLADPCGLVDLDDVQAAVGATFGEPVEGKTGLIKLCNFSPEIVDETFPVATVFAVDAETLEVGESLTASGFLDRLLAEDPSAEETDVAGLRAVQANGEWWTTLGDDLIGAAVAGEDGPDEAATRALLAAAITG
jgi:hypothetical protein